jgi:hypothetical protein
MLTVALPLAGGLLAMVAAIGFVAVAHRRSQNPANHRRSQPDKRRLPRVREELPAQAWPLPAAESAATVVREGRTLGTRLVATPQQLASWLHDQASPMPIGPGNLRADMLPGGTWGSNLRGILPSTDWRKISRACSAAACGRCQVCGNPGHDENGRPRGLDCHELWSFDYTRHVQLLAALTGLCPECHEVQHTGRAASVGRDRLVVAHLQRVNGWSRNQADAEVTRAWREYERRSQYDWGLDLSALAGIIAVDGYPALFVPAADRAQLGNSYWSAPRR